MKQDVEELENFIIDMTSKGYITIGQYLKLRNCIYRLDGRLGEEEEIIEYG